MGVDEKRVVTNRSGEGDYLSAQVEILAMLVRRWLTRFAPHQIYCLG